MKSIINLRSRNMKRILLCTVIAASISGSAFAQDIAVKPFEFEIGAGMAIGNKYGMDKVVPGHNAFMEARVNLFETSWNLGVQASFGATAKKKDDQLYHEINKFCIAVFTDYNFRNYGRVAPFIGLGIGRASIASAHLGMTLTEQLRKFEISSPYLS